MRYSPRRKSEWFNYSHAKTKRRWFAVKLELSSRKAAFLIVFIALSLAAARINFSPMLGTQNASFTLFQFLAPIGGGIAGPWLGAAAALAAQGLNIALFGGATDLFGVLRLAAAMAAAWYFGSKGQNVLVVPLAAMALYWLHPVGMQAPVYALFWLIPVAAAAFRSNLVARSLGATFTAHAVGTIAFLYTIPSTPELWNALLPVTAYERLVFTAGIGASFVLVNTLLDLLSSRIDLRFLSVERRYSLAPMRARDE